MYCDTELRKRRKLICKVNTLTFLNMEIFSWLDSITDMLNYSYCSKHTYQSLLLRGNWTRLASLTFREENITGSLAEIRHTCEVWGTRLRLGDILTIHDELWSNMLTRDMHGDGDLEVLNLRYVSHVCSRSIWETLISSENGINKTGECCMFDEPLLLNLLGHIIVSDLYMYSPSVDLDWVTLFANSFRVIFHASQASSSRTDLEVHRVAVVFEQGSIREFMFTHGDYDGVDVNILTRDGHLASENPIFTAIPVAKRPRLSRTRKDALNLILLTLAGLTVDTSPMYDRFIEELARKYTPSL